MEIKKDTGHGVGHDIDVRIPFSKYFNYIINDALSSSLSSVEAIQNWDLRSTSRFNNLERSRRDVKLNPVEANQSYDDVDVDVVGDLVLNANGLNHVNENRPVDTVTAAAEHTASDHRALPFSQIPNFFQAILTLVICGLLLAACLIIIKKTKAWCTRRKWSEEDEDNADIENQNQENKSKNSSCSPMPNRSENGTKSEVSLSEAGQPGVLNGNAHSVAKDSDNKDVISTGPSQGETSRPHSSCSNSSTKRKSPKVTFVRRESGPFGDEALAYAEESYRDARTRDHVDKHPYEEKQASWVRRLSSKRANTKKNKQNRRSLPIPIITIIPADSIEILGPESAPAVVTQQFDMPVEKVKPNPMENQDQKSKVK